MLVIVKDNEKSYWEECEELFEQCKYEKLRAKLEQIETIEEYEQEKILDQFFKMKNNQFFRFLDDYFYAREQQDKEDD